MSYEIAIINPRKRRSRKRASKAQIAARRRFVSKFAKGRKARRRSGRTRKVKKSSTGVSVMAKRRRRRRSSARTAKGRFVKKSRKASAPRARRRRRSGGKRRSAVGYTVGSRRVRRRKLNPRMRRRRFRRNPSMGGMLGQLIQASYGAGGALALNLGLSYLPLPDALKTGWARHGVRLAGAFGLGWAARKFLGGKGNAVATGALVVVMYDILKQVIGTASPEIGARLGEYEDVSLADDGFIDPASPIRGFGAYLQGPQADADDGSYADDGNVGAYLQGNMDGNLDGIGDYNYV